jgi:hypothetical protein
MYPFPDADDQAEVAEVFRALRDHPGVEFEWETIAPLLRDDGLVDAIPIEVLGMIVACKHFARENRDAHGDLARRRNRYRALLNAANLLHEHYEKTPVFKSTTDAAQLWPKAAEHNRQLLKAREALNWMKQEPMQKPSPKTGLPTLGFPRLCRWRPTYAIRCCFWHTIDD